MTSYIKRIVSTLVNFFARFFKIQDNKILFESGRNKVDCNPFAIYKYIKSNCNDDFKCIWIVDKGTDVSALEKSDYCYTRTFNAFYNMVTSKYWIFSQSFGGIVKKKKKQVYIQVWHGAGALKKCEYDCLNKEDVPNITVKHAQDWDFLITTDGENDKAMRSSLGYKKKSYILGNLDTDFLVNYNKNDVCNILKKLKIGKKHKKIIMYAPTFRDNMLKSDSVNIPIMKLGNLNNYIILLRLHPLISNKIKNIKLPSNFINACDYPNIRDLYLITDILITDYSSIIFPYMLLNKSLILYPYDYDEYLELRGGFYLDYKKDLPGPIVYNENDLVKTINNINDVKKKYAEATKNFNELYNKLNDGRVCERFIEKLKNKDFENLR